MGQVHAYRESSVPAAAQESSSSASDSASTETICKLMSWKRGHQRAMWTVKHIEGTKLRMKKRRKPSYRPEDLEAFYRLLGVYSELWSAQGSSTLNSGGQWLRVTLKPPPPLGSVRDKRPPAECSIIKTFRNKPHSLPTETFIYPPS